MIMKFERSGNASRQFKYVKNTGTTGRNKKHLWN